MDLESVTVGNLSLNLRALSQYATGTICQPSLSLKIDLQHKTPRLVYKWKLSATVPEGSRSMAISAIGHGRIEVPVKTITDLQVDENKDCRMTAVRFAVTEVPRVVSGLQLCRDQCWEEAPWQRHCTSSELATPAMPHEWASALLQPQVHTLWTKLDARTVRIEFRSVVLAGAWCTQSLANFSDDEQEEHQGEGKLDFQDREQWAPELSGSPSGGFETPELKTALVKRPRDTSIQQKKKRFRRRISKINSGCRVELETGKS